MQTSRETSLVFTHTHIRIGNTLWKTLVLLPLMRRSLFCVCIYGENTQAKIFGCVCENDESTSSQQQSEEQDVCLRIIDFCQSSSASVCRRVRSKIANLLLILFVLPTFVHVHIMCSCHSLCKSICMHVCERVCVCKFGFLFFSLLAKVSLTVTVAYFHHCFCLSFISWWWWGL